MVPRGVHAHVRRTVLKRAATDFPGSSAAEVCAYRTELLKLLCTSNAQGSSFNTGQGRGPRASTSNTFWMMPRLLDRGPQGVSEAMRCLWSESQQMRVPACSQANSGRGNQVDPHLTLGVDEDLFFQQSFSNLPDLCNHLGNSKNTDAGSHLERPQVAS